MPTSTDPSGRSIAIRSQKGHAPTVDYRDWGRGDLTRPARRPADAWVDDGDPRPGDPYSHTGEGYEPTSRRRGAHRSDPERYTPSWALESAAGARDDVARYPADPEPDRPWADVGGTAGRGGSGSRTADSGTDTSATDYWTAPTGWQGTEPSGGGRRRAEPDDRPAGRSGRHADDTDERAGGGRSDRRISDGYAPRRRSRSEDGESTAGTWTDGGAGTDDTRTGGSPAGAPGSAPIAGVGTGRATHPSTVGAKRPARAGGAPAPTPPPPAAVAGGGVRPVLTALRTPPAGNGSTTPASGTDPTSSTRTPTRASSGPIGPVRRLVVGCRRSPDARTGPDGPNARAAPNGPSVRTGPSPPAGQVARTEPNPPAGQVVGTGPNERGPSERAGPNARPGRAEQGGRTGPDGRICARCQGRRIGYARRAPTRRRRRRTSPRRAGAAGTGSPRPASGTG